MSEIINSVDRALDILLLLYNNGHEMGISEISRELDIYKSTVFRTLITLENKGFIYQNKDNGKYWLGVKIHAMGLLVGENLSIHDIIKPFTKELFNEFNEVVNVSILDNNLHDCLKSVIIHKETNEKKVLSVNPKIGSSTDCHCSAVGKCLLAFTKNIDFHKYNEKPLKKYTENTIDSWENLLDVLKKVKEDGYAIDNEEQEIGLICIGAPILDKHGNAVASISISGPTQRMRAGDFDYKIKKVIQMAKDISNQLK